jgi:hypothetical protein
VNKQNKEEKLSADFSRPGKPLQSVSSFTFIFFLFLLPESKVSRSKQADNIPRDKPREEEKLFNFLEKQERESKNFEENA